MQAFEYARARTVNEAASMLSQAGGRAYPLCGGTDLLAQLRENRRQADLVIDIKDIPELNEIIYDPAAGLTFGAAVPCYRLYEDETILHHYPGLIDAVSIIGGIQIQSRASVGGNLCNASPAADSIPTLIAQRAICTVASAQAVREVPVESFCTAPGRTTLKPGDLLVSIHLPPPPKRSGAAYQRFTPRNEMDIAVVGVGIQVTLSPDYTVIEDIRLGLGAVAATPLLVDGISAALRGMPVGDVAIADAMRIARASCSPITDMRGSASQRKHLVGVLTQRVMEKAIERAQKSREM